MTSRSNTPIRPKDRFLVFGAPAIEDAEIQEVVATLKSGWLGTGPKVSEFEKRFAAYKGGTLGGGREFLHGGIALEPFSLRRGTRR